MNSTGQCEFNQTSTAQCAEILLQVLRSMKLFQSSLALTLIFAIPAVIFNCIFIRVICRVAIVQTHAKVLLINTSLAALLLSLVDIATMTSYISMMATGDAIHVSHDDCVKQNILTAISSSSLAFSLVFLSLERSFATKFYKSYELRSTTPSVILAGISWVGSILLHISGVFQADNNSYQPICTSVLSYPSEFTFAISIIHAALAFISIFFFTFILRINKEKLMFLSCNEAQLNLSDRFQLRNNVEISSTVLPAAVLQFVALVSCKGGFIYALINPNTLSATCRILVILLAKAVYALYMLILPLSMILTNGRLRKNCKLLICRCQEVAKNAKVRPTPEVLNLNSLAVETKRATEMYMIELEIDTNSNQYSTSHARSSQHVNSFSVSVSPWPIPS